MKRILATTIIIGYLSALSWGVISHTLMLGNTSHPVMYYLIWDMFCGWSGYETRHHIIAEGNSGAHYLLNPAPWGEFMPYGPATRPDYDSYAIHSTAIAYNVLKRTDHEPIRRVYIVEENWSKRYNRPDFLWKMEFEEEKAPRSYFHTRVVCDADGNLLRKNNSWSTAVFEQTVAGDARMAATLKQAKPFLTVSEPLPRLRQNPAYPGGMQPFSNLGNIQQTSFSTPVEE